MRYFLIILLCLIVVFEVFGQTKTITVKVIISEPHYENGVDSEFHVLPGAIIFSSDTTEVGRTNKEGIFELKVDSSINQILAGFIGYDLELVQFSRECELVEIILMPDVIYDFVSAKKAARLRRKDRRILPDLYKQAYKKGILTQETHCR